MSVNNKVINFRARIDFNSMPIIPILKNTPRPLSEMIGINDKWYSFYFEWLFLSVWTEWKHFNEFYDMSKK